MKNIEISKTVHLLDGGCNACGIIEDSIYSLSFDGQRILLEALTVSQLVRAIALKNGFKQAFKSDAVDDYSLFEKNEQHIICQEEYNALIYSNGSSRIKSADDIADTNVLGEKVAEILMTIFQLGPVQLTFHSNDGSLLNNDR